MAENNMEKMNDEELVREAQNGSASAEEFLIKKYKELVKKKAHLYFIVGGDNEDVVQEGMIGIFKAIRSYDFTKNTKFRTHAETCITGQVINAIKGANRLKHQPLNNSLSLDAPENDTGSEGIEPLGKLPSHGEGDNPESLLLMKEITDYINNQDTGIFSKMERTVYELLVEGKTYVEIAKELGKSPKAIDNTIQRVKKKVFGYINS